MDNIDKKLELLEKQVDKRIQELTEFIISKGKTKELENIFTKHLLK